MPMTPEVPHLCSIYRSTRTGGKYSEPVVVSTENPCMIVPAGSGLRQNFMGGVEMLDSMLFIGYDTDIQAKDEIYDEGKEEWWVVREPPIKYESPSDWSPDHQQCIIDRKIIT